MLVAVLLGIASIGLAQEEPAGKALFLKNKCNTCHSVESQGIEALRDVKAAPDMSDAGNLIPDAAWAVKFVKREETKDGKKHRRPFKGSDKDVEQMIDWLMSLKKS
jgi:cytochrome c551/c552